MYHMSREIKDTIQLRKKQFQYSLMIYFNDIMEIVENENRIIVKKADQKQLSLLGR